MCLPVERRQGGNPDIHQAAFPFSLEPAILGQTFFPNIQPRHNLKPGQQRFLEMFGHQGEKLEHPVNPAADLKSVLARFQMDIASPQAQALIQQGFCQGNGRRSCPACFFRQHVRRQ